MPPPIVPGMAQANSKPPSPAARARCRQTAFAAPAADAHDVAVDLDGRELAAELEDERVDTVVGGEQIRAEADDRDGERTLRAQCKSSPTSASVSGRAKACAGPPVPSVV